MQKPTSNRKSKERGEQVIEIKWDFLGQAGTPDLINVTEEELRNWVETLPFGVEEKKSLIEKIIEIRNEAKDKPLKPEA